MTLRRTHSSITVPAVIAVGCARAVWNVATDTCPPGVARALVTGAIAVTITSTIFTEARTSRHFANVTSPAFERITVANAAFRTRTTTHAKRVTAFPSPARFAFAKSTVHWFLNTMNTRIIAGWAHPPDGAVNARHDGAVYGCTCPPIITIRLAWTVRLAAVVATPPRVTETRQKGTVAYAISRAVVWTLGNFAVIALPFTVADTGIIIARAVS